MSDKMYSIDDILNEIKENKIDETELQKYAAEFQKFDTTALLDDILGRENPLGDIRDYATEELTPEEEAQAENLLEEILSGQLIQSLEGAAQEDESSASKTNMRRSPAQPATKAKMERTSVFDVPKGMGPKPLKPLSHTSTGQFTAPLQQTPATANTSKFEVHIDSATGMISKVEIADEIKKQAVEAEQAAQKKTRRKLKKEAEDEQLLGVKPLEGVKKSASPAQPYEDHTEDVAHIIREYIDPDEIAQAAQTPKEELQVPEAEPEQGEKKTQPVVTELVREETVSAGMPRMKHEKAKQRPIKTETLKEEPQADHSMTAKTIELFEIGRNEDAPTIELTVEFEKENLVASSKAKKSVVSRKSEKEEQPEAQIPVRAKQEVSVQHQSVPAEPERTELLKEEKKTPVENVEEKQKEQVQKKQALPDTAQLKYIALRKNRENRVKGFALESDFDDTGKIAVPPAENLGKELENSDISINTTPGEKPVELFQETDVETKPEQQSDSPLFEDKTWTQKLPNTQADDNPIRMWKDKTGKSQEEEVQDEFTSPEQVEEVEEMLNETKSRLVFRLAAAVIILVLGLGLSVINSTLFGETSILPLLSAAENPILYCGANLLLLLFLLLASFDMVRDGVMSIFRRRLNRMTLYGIAFLMMFVFSLFIFTSPEMANEKNVYLYTPVLTLCVAAAYIGRLIGINRILSNFRFVSGGLDKYATDIIRNQTLAEDLTRGALKDYPRVVCNRKTPFLKDFLTESFSEDMTDKHAKYVVPAVSIIALIVGAGLFVWGQDIYGVLTAFTGILVVGAGAGVMFVVHGPLQQANKLLSRYGGVVLGYNATEDYSDINAAVVNANDLFEQEDVTLYGIKTFSNMAIDRAILDATSVLCETKSVLSSIFMKIISDRKDYLDPVDTVIYEDGMGISAWIKDRRVLIGSRELMINHNIDVPSRDYEERYLAKNRNLIYLSAAGELSAVFVVGITGNDEKRNILVDLYNEDIAIVVKSVDPILTKEQLAAVFEMPQDAFRVIPSRLHKELETLSDSDEHVNGAVASNGTFPAYVYSMLAAKRLGKNIFFGNLLNYASMGIAILLFIAFSIIPDGVSQLSNLMLCVYEAAWVTLIVIGQRLRKILP